MKKNEFLKILANAGPAALAGLGLFMICMPTEWEYNSVISLIGGSAALSAALVGGTVLLYKQYKARQKDLMNKNQGKQK